MMKDQTEIDVIGGMIKQEQQIYRIQSLKKIPSLPWSSTIALTRNPFQPDESIDCRYNMVDWCYRMIEFCHLNRETVAIAMNFVDRFVVTDRGQAYLLDNTLYQKVAVTVAVTALYTAIKVHEMQAIDIQSLSNISNVTYSVKQLEIVERKMIDALDWRMNPPTAMSFVRRFVEAISSHYNFSTQVKENVLKLSRVQTEYAVFDQDLIENKMSTIGYCSVFNALTIVMNDQVTLKQLRYVLAQKLQFHIYDNNEVELVQAKLYSFVCKHRNQNSVFSVPGKHQLLATSDSLDHHDMQIHNKESPRSVVLKKLK